MDGIAHRIKANSAIAVARAVTAERVNHPSDHLFTVKFYPGALHHVMDVNQATLNSALVELNELLPDCLIRQIKSAQCFEQRIHLMERYFVQKMTAKKTADHYTSLVTQTIALYTEDGMKFNVAELAFKSFTSSRTLTRYFERVIGISPKQYFESVRARTALSSFLNDRKAFDATAYGYDVYKDVCDCWKVPPISVETKQPFYSNKPALVVDGEMDPACTPLYINIIKHYMPNAQCFVFINQSHGVGGTAMRQMTQAFLDNPYGRIQSPNEKIIATH